MLYLPISKGWMVSRTARRVYFVCALSTIYLFATRFAILMAFVTARLSFTSNIPPVTSLLIELLLWPGVIGTAILWVGMWYFWFSFDNSSWSRKAIWCFLLYFLAPLAQPFYYFFVYRRSPLVKSTSDEFHPPVQSKLIPTD